MSGAISFDGPSFASMIEGWSEPFAGYGNLGRDEQLARLHDRQFRQDVAAAPEDCSRITSLCYDRWTILASTSAPECVGLTLRQFGQRVGEHPGLAMIDLAIADSLGTVLGAALSNIDEDEVRALVAHPDTMIGLGDAGAHIKSISNYCYPTYVLSSLVRDRGWLTLSDAVHRMTQRTAVALGLTARGTVVPGSMADVCVINLEALTLDPISTVKDLPGGSARLHRGAHGFGAVMVNGELVVENDQLTRRAAGRLLRVG